MKFFKSFDKYYVKKRHPESIGMLLWHGLGIYSFDDDVEYCEFMLQNPFVIPIDIKRYKPRLVPGHGVYM